MPAPAPSETPLTHAAARALCEAGYLTIPEYVRLCATHGWSAR